MATFYNQATLAYNNFVTTSNVVSGELREVLSATKTAISGAYRPGDTVTYAISIVNAGNVTYSGLNVSDNLGEYAFGGGTRTPLTYVAGSMKYYVNGVLQPAPTVTAGPPMNVSGINVPAGGNALLVYSVTVNSFAPQGTDGRVDNTATISGGGITPLTAAAAINANVQPNLSIVKALSPSTVVENEPLTYTFTIQNTGATPASATDNLVVTDTFAPILDVQSVTLNGVPLVNVTDYTYNAATGEFATVAGRITVPAATYVQDPTTGAWSVSPGTAVLAVTGTL